MELDPSEWTRVASDVQQLLDCTRDKLDQDSVDAVSGFLAVDEYEMALEGLLLDIMKAFPVPPVFVDWDRYQKLARTLQLDSDSVFDGYFWDRFSRYLTQ